MMQMHQFVPMDRASAAITPLPVLASCANRADRERDDATRIFTVLLPSRPPLCSGYARNQVVPTNINMITPSTDRAQAFFNQLVNRPKRLRLPV